MINPFLAIPKYLKIYQKYLGRKFYIVFFLSVLSGLSEGVSILMLIPLISSFNSSPSDFEQRFASNFLSSIFEFLRFNNSDTSIFIIIIIGFFGKGALLFLAYSLKATLQGQFIKNLKTNLYRGLSNTTYKYYLLKDTGKFTNLINEQINRSSQAFNNLTLLIIKVVNSIVYAFLAFFVSFKFGFYAFLIALITLTLFQKLSAFVRKMSTRTAKENGKLSKRIIEVMQSFKYLKATGKIKFLNKQIFESINILSKTEKRKGIAYAFTSSVREPLIIICIMTILYYQVVIAKNSIAPSLASIALFYRALNSLLGFQGNFQNLLEYGGSIELVDNEYKFLNENIENTFGKETSFNKSIKFENVFFSYDDNNYVLKNINLNLPSLSTVALVGSSGAGKSTFVDLLSYVLKPQKGNILIDNQNIKNIDLNKWRSQIAYVSQDTAIFDATIFFNISMSEIILNKNKNSIKKEVIKAAKQAYIHDFIMTLPSGYNTAVGERGIKLSGGQKQRLFIARELYRNPKILILDEATSSLDSKSEKFIKESIDLLKGKMTILIIAHRLSTIKDADYLYVLNAGEIIEKGSYKSLKADKNSHFSKLISLQQL